MRANTAFQVISLWSRLSVTQRLYDGPTTAASRNAPFELAIQWERPRGVQECMLEATREAAVALLEGVFGTKGTQPLVRSHL
jgi:hypothetical protein